MNQGESMVVKKISESGQGLRAPAGWQQAVRRRIRSEDEPVGLRLVELRPVDLRSGRSPSRASFFVSGLALAAALAAAFLVVRGQRRDARMADRKATIAMIVGLVELESEMAETLVEIDMTEARMDEAFQDLRSAQAEEDAAAEADELSVLDGGDDSPGSRRESDKRDREKSSKAKRKSAVARCETSGDPLCGL